MARARLLIVGSIANIIVVDAAARHGIRISWQRHARVGLPVTVATLAVIAAWLRLCCTDLKTRHCSTEIPALA